MLRKLQKVEKMLRGDVHGPIYYRIDSDTDTVSFVCRCLDLGTGPHSMTLDAATIVTESVDQLADRVASVLFAKGT